MKITYTFLILLFVCALNASAQIPAGIKKYPMSREAYRDQLASRLPRLNNTDRNIYQIYIDYTTANFDDNGYAWFFNTDYVAADTAGQNYGYMNYVAVAIKNIAGFTDPADPTNTYTDWSVLGLTDSFPNNIQLTIDSIFVHVGQENNSGELDTLQMQLVKLSGNAPTLGSTVLWSQRDSFSTPISVNTNDWTQEQYLLAYGPEYVNAPGQKVAGVLKYYNKNKQDTLITTAEFIDNGQGGADQPSTYFTSYVRPCYLTSIYWTGQLSYGPGAYFEAEDWDMFYLVTINDVLGINDNFDNLVVHYITPNPASSNANIWFGLKSASDVTINLLDVSGKFIKTIKKGNYGAGSFYENFDVSDVNSGMYLVSVQAGNNTPVLSKLVVNK